MAVIFIAAFLPLMPACRHWTMARGGKSSPNRPKEMLACARAEPPEGAMGVKLYAMTCGTLTGALANLMEGGEGEVTLPIPAYLIEHPKGTVLFDSGMHPDCQRDPTARAGARIGEWFKFDYHPGDEVSARLEAIGRDPAKIDILINSHLHFDHVGGNALIPNATVVVQKSEWEAGMDPEMAALRGFNRRDFDLGHQVKTIEGEHDLFGDGSLVLFPTYGHTPGHQSLKLKLDSGDVVLAADACYFCRTLAERRLPVRVHDRDAMHRSLDTLARLQSGGARIFFGHDSEFWKTVPQGPQAIA
jgi:N-acyl homoserine lactone hydrolase